MTFDLVLKECLLMTQTKLHVLSKEVGYDPSYLSRFSNGLLLPNPKVAHQLMNDLGTYFSSVILQNGLLSKAQKELGLKNVTEETLESQLIDLFIRSFQNSMNEKTKSLKIKKESEMIDFVGLVLEIRDILDVHSSGKLVVSLPPQLLKLFEKEFNKNQLESVESQYSFIYLEDTFCYVINVFEDYQKLVVARFNALTTLREIQFMLGL